jgi:D,D-heptose 1,7-bisphosphate phosphatase
VLLDRDGTIIIDSGYVGSVERVEFIDGAIEAIAALNRAGLPVAVVTNQAGVARGHYGIDDVEQVHKHMIAELARGNAHVDLWLFCPYHPDGIVDAFARASSDRKPAAGMALAAAQALDLDLRASWVVGDGEADLGLARAVGARPLRLGARAHPEPDVTSAPDLAAAVRLILDDRAANALRGRPSFPAHRFAAAEPFGSAYASPSSPPRPPRSTRRTTATLPSTPAATADPPRSPTICSATTSRACATEPTSPPVSSA